MATFKNRCLAVLDRVYAFISDKAYTTDLNLDVPVALVHDVSREAELGSAPGINTGWGCQIITNSKAGAGTTRVQQDAYSWLLSGFDGQLDPYDTDVDIWITHVDVSGGTAPGNVTTLSVALVNYGQLKPTLGAATETYRVLFTGIGTRTFLVSNYTATGDVNMMAQPDQAIEITPGMYGGPWRVFRGERITTHGVYSAAGQFDAYIYFWVGKKGTTPPGVR